jgi:hypothetical protein
MSSSLDSSSGTTVSAVMSGCQSISATKRPGCADALSLAGAARSIPAAMQVRCRTLTRRYFPPIMPWPLVIIPCPLSIIVLPLVIIWPPASIIA